MTPEPVPLAGGTCDDGPFPPIGGSQSGGEATMDRPGSGQAMAAAARNASQMLRSNSSHGGFNAGE